MAASGPTAPSSTPRLRVSAKAVLGFAAYLLLTPLVLFLAGGEAAWLAAWVYFVLAIVAVIGSRLIALKVSPEMLVERSRFGENSEAVRELERARQWSVLRGQGQR